MSKSPTTEAPPSPRRVQLAWIAEDGEDAPTPCPTPGEEGPAGRRGSAGGRHCLLWPGLRPQSTDERLTEWCGAANALLRGASVGSVLTSEQFVDVLSAFESLFTEEDPGRLATIEMKSTSPWDSLCVIGDLHGQRGDLLGAVLGPFARESRRPSHLLFLGDYVDRGPDGADVVALILLLKLLYPGWVTLLRGNHEEPSVTQVYGYAQELERKYPREGGGYVGAPSHPLWETSHSAFARLPVAAVVVSDSGQSIFCCHGGLSPPLLRKRVSDIIPGLPALVDACPLSRECTGEESIYGERAGEEDQQVLDGLLWSDPSLDIDPIESEDGLEPNARGCGWGWSPAATGQFLALNGFAWMCRAHQCQMAGYRWDHDSKVLTLFSAANYCGTAQNLGAVMLLSCGSDGNFEVNIVTHSEESTSCIVRDVAPALPNYFAGGDQPADPVRVKLPVRQANPDEQLKEVRRRAAKGGGSNQPLPVLEAALRLCGAGGKPSRWCYTDDAGTDESAEYCFDFRIDGTQIVGRCFERGKQVEGTQMLRVCLPLLSERPAEEDRSDTGGGEAELLITDGSTMYCGAVEEDVMRGRWRSADDGSTGEYCLRRCEGGGGVH